MGAENPTRAKGHRRMRKAWTWLGPHLPGALLELVVFALVALPATYFLEQRIAGRQQEQAETLASTAEVQENLRFARQLSIQNGGASQDGGTKPMNGIDLHGANLSGLELGCRTHETFREDEHPCKDGPIPRDAAQLIEANLAGADLSFTDLTGAMMVQADLSSARLARARLGGANLTGANLVGAYLSAPAHINPDHLGYRTVSGAYLAKARLEFADMTGANLEYAWLMDAKMRGAKLVGADLSSADLLGADLRGADLTDAKLSSRRDFICVDDKTRWPKSVPRPSNPNGCKDRPYWSGI
jgi:uncharacterized protein YjbI with pentapeptide repeats